MDAVLQDFLGNKPSMGTSSLELQLANTQEHQEMDNKVVQEQAGEAMPEQTDETPQVLTSSLKKIQFCKALINSIL